MHVFIDFWKLETENSISHVFSFLHNLSFKNNFCFLSILGCQTRFLVLKIENCFWKQKIRRKNNYQTYPNLFGRKKMNERNKRSKGFFFFKFFFFFMLNKQNLRYHIVHYNSPIQNNSHRKIYEHLWYIQMIQNFFFFFG